jgi:hypothetical protein
VTDVLRYRPEHFVVDGSLRDVCVLDVGIPEWQLLLESLKDSGWEYSLEVTGQDPAAELSAADIFEILDSNDEASARLAIRVGHIWFPNFFFDPSEIEFSFDPSEISGEAEFAALVTFMSWLATAVRKPAILTMETTDHRTIPALLEIPPA